MKDMVAELECDRFVRSLPQIMGEMIIGVTPSMCGYVVVVADKTDKLDIISVELTGTMRLVRTIGASRIFCNNLLEIAEDGKLSEAARFALRGTKVTTVQLPNVNDRARAIGNALLDGMIVRDHGIMLAIDRGYFDKTYHVGMRARDVLDAISVILIGLKAMK